MIHTIVTTKGRPAMLERCISSLAAAGDHVTIAINEVTSDQETRALCQDVYDRGIAWKLNQCAPGVNYYSTAIACAELIKMQFNPRPSDLLYLCADDYEMRPFWTNRVTRFMSESLDVFMATLELEPLFPWNEPTDRIERGPGVSALVRPSLPGANWLIPWRRWPNARRLIMRHRSETMSDHLVCAEAAREGLLVALDLAEHIGAYDSSTGNKAFHVNAQPLPAHWQI